MLDIILNDFFQDIETYLCHNRLTGSLIICLNYV